MQFDAQDRLLPRALPGRQLRRHRGRRRARRPALRGPRPGEIRIVDIALLPGAPRSRHRAGLIADLQREAAPRAAVVSIHVERSTPRPGSTSGSASCVADDLGVYRRMEWTPAESPAHSGEDGLVAHAPRSARSARGTGRGGRARRAPGRRSLRQDGSAAREDERELQPRLSLGPGPGPVLSRLGQPSAIGSAAVPAHHELLTDTNRSR